MGISMASGWWYYLPLWKIWLRQLGWWLFPIIIWKHKIHVPGLYLAKYAEASGCIYIYIYWFWNRLLVTIGTSWPPSDPPAGGDYFPYFAHPKWDLSWEFRPTGPITNAHECNANKCKTSTEILTAGHIWLKPDKDLNFGTSIPQMFWSK